MKSKESGFTLVEMLVATALFGLLVGLVFQLFISSFSVQRNTLSIQESANQISFVAEYMERALRQARKESANPAACLTGAGRGWNYEVSAANESITFLDRDNLCRKFSFDPVGQQIFEEVSTDNQAAHFTGAEPLTPGTMAVTGFRIEQRGADEQDNEQPRVTLVIEAEATEADAKVRVQTTISQRTFDVVQIP